MSDPPFLILTSQFTVWPLQTRWVTRLSWPCRRHRSISTWWRRPSVLWWHTENTQHTSYNFTQLPLMFINSVSEHMNVTLITRHKFILRDILMTSQWLFSAHLHLHGNHDDERVASFDSIATGDVHLLDCARHRSHGAPASAARPTRRHEARSGQG